MKEEEYWYWFCNIKDIFISKQRKLMEKFGTPENVYNASYESLALVPGITDGDVENIVNSRADREKTLSRIKYEIAHMRSTGVDFVYYSHERYPDRLKLISEPPYILYYKGSLPDNNTPAAAIVGTSVCTSYGRNIAYKVGKELSMAGVNVISGMALGIDSAAQKGAVDAGGHTYSVLGCGVDICYPRQNIDIYTRISESGGIISEYPIGSPPVAWQFPLRNRIISGLADVVIVIEAKEKSGSLITAEYALDQGKDIYAVPGRITDNVSAGCNRLIKSGAGVLTDVKDVLSELGIYGTDSEGFLLKNKIGLEKDLQVVYSCLDLLPKSLDTIIEETGFNASTVLQLLVRLQLKDLVCEPVTNYYSRNI